MLVIAVASLLIGLRRAGGLDWLAPLIGSVVITPIFLQEVLPVTSQRGEPEIQAAITNGCLQMWRKPIAPLPLDLGDLDAGESQSIALAL